MIAEALLLGAKNARTAKSLAEQFNCTARDITRRIEYERRHGAPICASSDTAQPGYYLAANAEELTAYCRRLQKRTAAINRTRAGLEKTKRRLIKAAGA